jgi:GNAT superfamily N-acetyltransferase
LISVVHARPEDAEVLAGLMDELARFYGGEHTEPLEEMVALISAALFGPESAARVLIAWDGVKPAGFASYTFLWPAVGFTRSLYLKELFVGQAYRRAGAGRQLMEELHAIARREGCSRVEWTTDVRNAAARRFYASLGFAENGSKIFYRSTL